MPCYVVNPTKPSRAKYEVMRKEFGYFGSYEDYVKEIGKYDPKAVQFITGDLGDHCSDCSGFGDYLCDYPVGKGKTCDRKMCEESAHEIAYEVHYCEAHFKMWEEFKNSEEHKQHLENVSYFRK